MISTIPMFLAQASSGSTDLGTMSASMVDNLTTIGLKLYSTTLGPEMLALAYALIPPILIVQITLIGLKIMMSIADPIREIQNLFIRTLVIAALIMSQIPQIAIGNAMLSMEKVGRYLGVQVAKSGTWAATTAGGTAMSAIESKVGDGTSSDTSNSTMPIVALWEAWLADGTIPTDADAKFKEIIEQKTTANPKSPVKFSAAFIRNRIFGGLTSKTNNELTFYLNQGKASNNQATTAEDAFGSLTNGTFGKILSSVIALGEKAGPMIFSTGLALMQPLSTIGIAMAMGTMIMSTTMAPQVAVISSIGCVYFVFFLIASLSIGLMPLLYFDSFARTWINLMQTLIGLALIPFFFHIMSGIGFAIMTTAFEVMFPVDPTTATSLPAVLNALISADFIQALMIQLNAPTSDPTAGSTASPGLLTQLVTVVIQNAMAMMLSIGRQVIGVSIISSFVLGGIAISGSALGIAVSWKEFFGNTHALQSIQQGLLQIQTGISSGMGAAYSQGMQAVGSATQAISGAFNKKGS